MKRSCYQVNTYTYVYIYIYVMFVGIKNGSKRNVCSWKGMLTSGDTYVGNLITLRHIVVINQTPGAIIKRYKNCFSNCAFVYLKP